MAYLRTGFREIISDILNFCEVGSGLKLRWYQEGIPRAIIESVWEKAGRTFVVMLPRQSGKNELQAQIEAYLLLSLCALDAELVKASPTWKPQSINAMRRLERVLSRNLITKAYGWTKESGYIYRIDNARIYFLSGGDSANVVGATANELLQCDEAQDVGVNKWDKDFAPMAASTNATRVFWGTAWTSKTLLARERKAAEKEEEEDGIKRVWILTAEDVAKEVPAYGEHVAGQVKKMGRNHPLIRTQYFSEEIDAKSGMFPDERIALMQGSHPKLTEPVIGRLYAMCIDVAGEDEGALGEDQIIELENPARDSTSLTLFDVDLSSLPPDEKGAPTYRTVRRFNWVGEKHTKIYQQIRLIADEWDVQYIVVDSTGVGHGLASFLEKIYPGRVIPYLFTTRSKSDLGWGFLAVIETGRFKECVDGDSEFWLQVTHCQSEVLAGQNQTIRWGVPDGTRDQLTGELIHDDELISTALCSALDNQEWMITTPPLIINSPDPLEEMDKEGF